MASDTANSNFDEEDPSNSVGAREDSTSGSSVRIKDIAEINSTINNNGCEENGKRKMPAWMQSQLDEKNVKKTKVNNSDGSGNKNISGNEQESVVASTSDLQGTSNPARMEDCKQSSEDDNCEAAPSTHIKIKSESPNCSDNCSCDTVEGIKKIKVEIDELREIKFETTSDDTVEAGTSPTIDNKTQNTVVKEEATSTIRDSCKFGIRCYRKNPQHRAEEAHPGDSDYRRPDYPPPPKGTPPCPYGDKCYRRNPYHFQSFSHPPSTDFKKNWQLRQRRLRKQKKDPDFEYDDFIDDADEDLDDPFSDNGSDDEYIPSDDD